MFFFVCWGKRKVETRVGYAADYCSVCRDVSSFGVDRIGESSHIYYIPVGRERCIGHTQTCLQCHTTFESYLHRFRRLTKTLVQPVQKLASETFPDVYNTFADKLALQEQIAQNPEMQRQAVLLDHFRRAAPHFVHGGRERGLDFLVEALRPLDPSEDEIRACLTFFRGTGAPMGNMIRTASVTRRLSCAPVRREFDY